MRHLPKSLLVFMFAGVALCCAKDIEFGGRKWTVRPNGTGGPGPCHWSDTNAWVDAGGLLHLKISHAGSQWHCAEIYTPDTLGFGSYQWQVISRLDAFDKNVVLGLFPYRGPDGQNEIDIEIAHWGNAAYPLGNFTVYPAAAGIRQTSRSFPFSLNGDYTTHRFNWQPEFVYYQMLHGHQSGNANEITNWTFSPKNPAAAVPQQPMPLHLNLWLFQGRAPSDGKEVEVIIKSFDHTPESLHKPPPTTRL